MTYSTNKPYRIICDETNNSKEDIEAGRINITIEYLLDSVLYEKLKEVFDNRLYKRPKVCEWVKPFIDNLNSVLDSWAL